MIGSSGAVSSAVAFSDKLMPFRWAAAMRAMSAMLVSMDPAARTLLRATGFRTEVVTDGAVVETHAGNPLDFIAAYQQRFKVALRPGMPRFCGGLAGYFGYDAVRFIEPKLAKTSKGGGIDTPDILLLQCEELAVIDNLSGRLYLIVYANPAEPESFHKAWKALRDGEWLATTEDPEWGGQGMPRTVAVTRCRHSARGGPSSTRGV